MLGSKLLEIEDKLETELIQIISENQKEILVCDKSFRTLWIHNENYSIEFRYVILLDRITISRICFNKRRNGCLSKCIETIKKYKKELGLNKIIIQSVETKECSNFCYKNHFIPNDYCIEVEDFKIGDYELELKD